MARRFGHRATLLGVVVIGLLFPAGALAAPETTIETGQPRRQHHRRRDADLHLRLSDPLATFECRVDSADMEADFTECTSPHTTAALPTVPTPSRSAPSTCSSKPIQLRQPQLHVDTDRPDTTITRARADPSATPRAELHVLLGRARVDVQCRVDELPPSGFGPCAGPGTPTSPIRSSDGAHSFEVQAIDAAGNSKRPPRPATSPSTRPPNTLIDSGPTGATRDSTPTFGFSSRRARVDVRMQDRRRRLRAMQQRLHDCGVDRRASQLRRAGGRRSRQP